MDEVLTDGDEALEEEGDELERLTESPEIGDGTVKKRKFSEFEDDYEIDHPLKLFIGNIAPLVSRREVMRLLKRAGKVARCWMPEKSTYKRRPKKAFAIMANEGGFRKALKLAGTVLDGRPLRIYPFQKDPPVKEESKPPEHAWHKEPLIVLVSNIPFKATQEDLEKHFESVGDIKHINIPGQDGLHPGQTYIKLGDQASFEKALEMHRTVLDGRVINVVDSSRVSKQPKRKSRGKRGRHGRGLTWDTLCRP